MRFLVVVCLIGAMSSPVLLGDDPSPPAKTRAIQPLDDLSGIEKTNLALMEGFTSLWIFTLGACLGSFLNVVIYRLPAGLKLGSPPSRCSAASLGATTIGVLLVWRPLNKLLLP